jgi:hypothetical protein
VAGGHERAQHDPRAARRRSEGSDGAGRPQGRRGRFAEDAAGLHYRFDCEAGDEIGRRAAALALARLAPALR